MNTPEIDVFVLTENNDGGAERPIAIALDEQTAQEWCDGTDLCCRRWYRCSIPYEPSLADVFPLEKEDWARICPVDFRQFWWRLGRQYRARAQLALLSLPVLDPNRSLLCLT